MKPPLYIKPQTHKYSVIWLHGLGDVGDSFYHLISNMNLTHELEVKFIFPTAPSKPVTLNSGLVMPSWYDIVDMNNPDRTISVEDLNNSATYVQGLIEEEVRSGIAPCNITLAGFSQGGALALHTGLYTWPSKYKTFLKSILALSCYAPTLPDFHVCKEVPVLITHGSFDETIPLDWSVSMYQKMRKMGFSVENKTYQAGHEISLEQISDLKSYFLSHFK